MKCSLIAAEWLSAVYIWKKWLRGGDTSYITSNTVLYGVNGTTWLRKEHMWLLTWYTWHIQHQPTNGVRKGLDTTKGPTSKSHTIGSPFMVTLASIKHSYHHKYRNQGIWLSTSLMTEQLDYYLQGAGVPNTTRMKLCFANTILLYFCIPPQLGRRLCLAGLICSHSPLIWVQHP